MSRGESAYLIEAAKSYFAYVEEGLGTKNLVAAAMYRLAGKSYYDHIAQDTVAMIVSDMITLGALRAGRIERSDKKKVVIKPKGMEYSGATLGVR